MERRDNYAIASAQARKLFMNYDHAQLAKKLNTALDDDYLYTKMLSEPYRIHRRTGDISRFHEGQWVDGNSFEEALTLLDLVCDSQENRFLRGSWKDLKDFGMQFHRNLTERRDPLAEQLERESDRFAAACQKLGGEKFPHGDVAYSIELFDGLRILVQLWFGEEEFPPQLRWLWDENALMYLKYETMYYAINLLVKRLKENM